MSLLRVIGRPMLASMFITGGLHSLRDPKSVAPAAEPVVRPITERVQVLPDGTEQLVRLNGTVQVGAGVLLAFGRAPRLAALALAATTVPTTLAAHRFWEEEDPGARAQQRIHFFKNMSMLGGLLIAADDTGGAPSLLWRTRHGARTLRREAKLAQRSARAGARPAAAVSGVRSAVGGVTSTVGGGAKAAAGGARSAASGVTSTVGGGAKAAVGGVKSGVGSAKAKLPV
ncbi:hypothetical protein GCM10010358_50390 [Streptomyces minutiscleroticus]|uniref:DoxX family protein n=1 Tax=Streptomyces minutiscleroticus TaxID=68238 RepID=A0A918NRM4_9ACTN|nr:hypothetical protein GCM10010358_50390 [Streptomyces minutiscleroticus]